ncbi:sulfotransferase family 2 domain-containing protein [Parvibaculum sp.]|uniref:sulfotransferase family 2 domain-containing protein n=1 Tax=Parvibaculum sp. TaxID=2024848 RepID=UPI003BA86760
MRSLLLDDPMRPASFIEFLEAVKRKKSIDMNGHWRPQADFVMVKDIPYSFIGRQETLDDDLKALGRMIGKDLSSLRLKSKNRTGAGTMLDEYYTPEAIDLVRHVYAADFETFGYSRDLPEQGISAPLSKRAAGKAQAGAPVLNEAES